MCSAERALEAGRTRRSALSSVSIRPPGAWAWSARGTGRAHSTAERRGDRSACDAPRWADQGPSAGCSGEASGAAQELLDGILGRDGVDGQPGAQLQAGNLAEPRVDLPVPVVRGIDLLTERRRVEDEVVGRPVEGGGKGRENLPEGLGRGRDVPWTRP